MFVSFGTPLTDEHAVPAKALVGGKGGIVVVIIWSSVAVIDTHDSIIVLGLVLNGFRGRDARRCKGSVGQTKVLYGNFSTAVPAIWVGILLVVGRGCDANGCIHRRRIDQSGSTIGTRSVCGLRSKQGQCFHDRESSGINGAQAEAAERARRTRGTREAAGRITSLQGFLRRTTAAAPFGMTTPTRGLFRRAGGAEGGIASADRPISRILVSHAAGIDSRIFVVLSHWWLWPLPNSRLKDVFP